MRCPNCQEEMKDKSYYYFGIEDWDMDYESMYQRFRCKKCKISFENGEWKIPRNIELATKKQISTVSFINSELGTDFNPLLKVPTSKFISINLKRANETKSKRSYGVDAYDTAYDEYFYSFEEQF